MSGIVQLNGKPVKDLSVSFIPKHGRAANGMTDAEGRFELTTFELGDGALLGEHVVTIVPVIDPPAYIPDPTKPLPPGMKIEIPPVPRKHRDPSTSDLRKTVEADAENFFEFNLTAGR